MKRCTKCLESKPLDMFHRWSSSSDGRQTRCKVCMLEAKRIWRINNLEVARERKRKYDIENKEAISKSRKEKYWKDPEKGRQEVLNLRRKNPAKYRAIGNATDGRRRALLLNAVPTWANREKVRAIYAEAAQLNANKKMGYAVDHIVPLQSKLVCGLHNEFNLQILGRSENIAKSNRQWPDMP